VPDCANRKVSHWWHAPLARALWWIGLFAQAGNIGDWGSTLVGVCGYHMPERGKVVLSMIARFGCVPGASVAMAAWAVGFGLAVWAGRRWVDTGSVPIVTLILVAYFGALKWLVAFANVLGLASAR